MKIIFLDIDGVLNWVGTADRIGSFYGLDPELIANLNKITDAVPEAKIVVSSTWRKATLGDTYQDFDGLKKLLRDRGVKAEIIGHTPIRFGSWQRGDEIREYLREDFVEENPGQTIENFVVIDDSDDGFDGSEMEIYKGLDDLGDDVYEVETVPSLRPNHVRTFWYGEQHLIGGDTVTDVPGGLRDHHVEQAIACLNGKPVR